MQSPFLQVPEDEHLASNEHAFAIFDANPASPGHVLVIPRRPISSWFDATVEEQHAAIRLLAQVKQLLDDRFGPDAYNVGFNDGVAAGQTVFHAHLHVIPRYSGDMSDPRGGVRHAVGGHGDPQGERTRMAAGALPWIQEHEDELVARPADEARVAVEAAGWAPRLAPLRGSVTADYRSGRVTLWLDEDGVVRAATSG